jgi:outer membrane receptor protein involved in Fe transport
MQTSIQKNYRKISYLASTIAFLLATSAVAQQSGEEKKAVSELETIIVTGTASRGQTALESSVGVTLITADDLAKDVPFGLSETLQAVPGLFVQNSGGASSNNIGVRGLPSGSHLRYINVQEDGLSVNYDQYTVDATQRYDLGIQRVEVIRGGTSGILAANGSGAIINYIYKKGSQESEGIVKISATSYDNIRTDLFFGGAINKDWTIAMSGYYTQGDSPRENGFNGERGGQLRFNLTRIFNNGELNLTYKKVDESNAFVLPLPVQRNPLTGNLTELPGFDLLQGNVNSFDNSRTNILFADGSRLEQNIVDGFDVDADVFTAALDWDLSDELYFHHSSRYSSMNRLAQGHWTGSFGGDSILPAEDYLTNDALDFGGGYGTVGEFYTGFADAQRCFQYVTSQELLCAGSAELANLNGNGYAQVLNALREPISRDQFLSDTRLTWKTDKNTLTVGVMLANLSHDRALASSLFMSDVTGGSPRTLDIVAVDTDGNILGYLSDAGVVKHRQWSGDDDLQVDSQSIYINDEFQVTGDLRIDAGIRWESAEYQGASLNGLGTRVAVAGAFDSDGNDVDNISANNYSAPLKGTGGVSRREVEYKELAWTLGFNYMLSEDYAIYGRYAEGFQTPRADRLGDITLNTPEGIVDLPVDEIELAELGIRYSGDTLAASATLFNTEFPTLLTGGFGFDTGGTQVLNEASLSVVGVEFDVTWSPIDVLMLNLVGVFQSGELADFNTTAGQAFNGNNVARTPDEQLRFSGTFEVTDDLNLFADYRFIGERFGANDNIVKFDSCGIAGVGGAYYFTRQFSVQAKVNNLTDELCFTEGNPRATVSENALDIGFARPMVGRNVIVSAQFTF